MTQSETVAILLDADYAIFGRRKPVFRSQYADQAPDFTHASDKLDPAFLPLLRPANQMQNTAGYFHIEEADRAEGAWVVMPVKDKIVLSNLRSMDLDPRNGVDPHPLDAAQRNEFIEQISLIFDLDMWSRWAPDLFRQGREWILSVRKNLHEGKLSAIRPARFYGQEQGRASAIQPSHAMSTLLKAYRNQTKWFWHIDALQYDCSYQFFYDLLHQLNRTERQTFSFGYGFAHRTRGFDAQIFHGNQLDFHDMPMAMALDLRHQLRLSLNNETISSKQELWNFFAERLQPVLPQWSKMARELARIEPVYHHRDFNEEERILICLDLFDLAFDCQPAPSAPSQALAVDLMDMFAGWLSVHHFLSGRIWLRVASLVQAPYIIANLFEASESSVHLSIRYACNFLMLSPRERDIWPIVARKIRCMGNWKLTHWEADHMSHLDLAVFGRYVLSCYRKGDLKYVTTPDLLGVMAAAGLADPVENNDLSRRSDRARRHDTSEGQKSRPMLRLVR